MSQNQTPGGDWLESAPSNGLPSDLALRVSARQETVWAVTLRVPGRPRAIVSRGPRDTDPLISRVLIHRPGHLIATFIWEYTAVYFSFTLKTTTSKWVKGALSSHPCLLSPRGPQLPEVQLPPQPHPSFTLCCSNSSQHIV